MRSITATMFSREKCQLTAYSSSLSLVSRDIGLGRLNDFDQVSWWYFRIVIAGRVTVCLKKFQAMYADMVLLVSERRAGHPGFHACIVLLSLERVNFEGLLG